MRAALQNAGICIQVSVKPIEVWLQSLVDLKFSRVDLKFKLQTRARSGSTVKPMNALQEEVAVSRKKRQTVCYGQKQAYVCQAAFIRSNSHLQGMWVILIK